MAKLKMQKLRIIAMRSERKQVLEQLQRSGLVEIEYTPDDPTLLHDDTSAQCTQLEDFIKDINGALAVLEEAAPEKKPFLAGWRPRPVISAEEYADVLSGCGEGLSLCADIERLRRELEEIRSERVRAQTRLDALSPWKDLTVPMNFRGTSSTTAFIGTVQSVYTSESLALRLAQLCPEVDGVHSQVLCTMGDSTCVMVLCMKADTEDIEGALRSVGYARPSESADDLPRNVMAQLESEQSGRDSREEEVRQAIVDLADRRGELQYLADACTVRLEKYQNIQRLGCGENCFIIEGWTPERDYGQVESEMAQFGAYCERIETGAKDNPPVALKNNAFTEGGEPVLEMYSMPSKGDIDPTPIMSVWYYFLFGILLGDAAYGAIMVIACAFVLFKFKPEARQRKNMKLFMFSGFSAVIWGIIFGSYFGNLPNVIGEVFFGMEGAIDNYGVVRPLWFDPIAEPMNMMIFSIALGGIHLFCGLILGIYVNFKNGDYVSGLCGPGAWLLLLVSGIGWALVTMMGDSLPFTVPPVVSNILLILVGVAVVTILLMAGRPTKSPFKRLLKGAYELYGATSYLSDFMSYSRLLALGLATGVISQVFNTIGTMFGGGVFGAIMLVIVGIIGHALNIGISLIGCYVHDCRLQYVEFFGKFYEGGGRAFTPLTANTKYFRFKEDN
ncbi:MAG: V-type ATP synthase subunit I [Ruminococcaceae bacterium]|nr:V-type ATP synthase subunit I [Oscillospiraceae bacterium]